MDSKFVKKYEKMLSAIISGKETSIERLFSKFRDVVARLAISINVSGGEFLNSLNKRFNASLAEVVKKLYNKIYTEIHSGIVNGWSLSNKKNDSFIKDFLSSAKLAKQYKVQNENAMNAFVEREINGLNLSDNVWQKSKDAQQSITNAIKIGIANGISHSELGSFIKDYLKNPSGTITNVDEKGIAQTLSSEQRKGVYSNPMDNAKRLARTEINMAYKTADQERWKKLDFVIGYEVHLSGNHTTLQNGSVVKIKDICDQLQGRYPKTFKFTGWHPNCRCYCTPILKSLSEFDEGKKSTNEVTDVPQSFKNWVSQNSDRLRSATTKPYWFTDNQTEFDITLK